MHSILPWECMAIEKSESGSEKEVSKSFMCSKLLRTHHQVRSGHGGVGKQQCCQETPGGTREETGQAFIGASSSEGLATVSKFYN